jgi:hypothetical protein
MTENLLSMAKGSAVASDGGLRLLVEYVGKLSTTEAMVTEKKK